MNTIFYLHSLVLRLTKDESGATATEYVLLIAISAIAAIGMTQLINSA